ncbi:MAG: polysaccharide export protein [Chromatiales bacterium]|nr:polysaccharide export protein [Chromatiales bacterium]
MRHSLLIAVLCLGSIALGGCASKKPVTLPTATPATLPDEYVIGPGDTVQVFVWQHPEVSVTIPVRPDGRISTPLVEDLPAVGKTPTKLARDIELALAEYIRSPKVNVIVSNFIGTFSNQVRVVGQAAAPQAIPFRQEMTVLDVMIQVGGLAENAAGNRATIVRREGDQQLEIPVRLDDLLNKGKIAANIPMRPGDVLIIPESRF